MWYRRTFGAYAGLCRWRGSDFNPVWRRSVHIMHEVSTKCPRQNATAHFRLGSLLGHGWLGSLKRRAGGVVALRAVIFVDLFAGRLTQALQQPSPPHNAIRKHSAETSETSNSDIYPGRRRHVFLKMPVCASCACCRPARWRVPVPKAGGREGRQSTAGVEQWC